jgi:hypothetical protein
MSTGLPLSLAVLFLVQGKINLQISPNQATPVGPKIPHRFVDFLLVPCDTNRPCYF